MARKSSLSTENLIALGAEKLAALIVDEAKGNSPFRKIVNAALAGSKGAEAVAALIDRRLAALEKARAMIDWTKEKEFRADLAATVATIVKELGAADPMLAALRLLRFIDSHAKVFNRIDDSSGRIQAVYWDAVEQAPKLVEAMAPDARAALTAPLAKSLGLDSHGLAPQLAMALIPFLPKSALADWDAQLAKAGDDDRWVATRQAIADARGDLDLFLALEQKRPEWRRDPLRAAEKLLAAGRLDEALDWARQTHRPKFVDASLADLVAGRFINPQDIERRALEARILDAKGEPTQAQALRWQGFETTLNPNPLRDYLKKLGDFEEEEALERAFALAEASPQFYLALDFFIGWPDLARAAKLVLARPTEWDGRHHEFLGQAAPALEDKFPLAASALYRALLDDILARAKSPAYGHGARYLSRLDALAQPIDDWGPLDNHAAYRLRLQKTHGRKRGFWSLTET